MNLLGAPTLAPGLRDLFDGLPDALLVFDRRGRVGFVNTAALRLLGCEAGTPAERLAPFIGEPATQWLVSALRGRGDVAALPPAPVARLKAGGDARIAVHAIGGGHHGLRLVTEPTPRPVPAPSAAAADATSVQALALLWQAPFPCVLQDAAHRVVDVNPAFCEMTGHGRDAVRGTDLLDLLPKPERAAAQARRGGERDGGEPLVEQRLVDAQGRVCWFRGAQCDLQAADGQRLRLTLMQDSTAEHVARERADRAARELDDWFVLNPLGMLLYDEAGLLIRSNPAFEALVGTVPALMSEAVDPLQRLLGWREGGPGHALVPGAVPQSVQGWLPLADGRQRPMRATVRCYLTPSGQRRYMAVVEDRSTEEERDLAEVQIGALMDAAGVGLATFAESSGWLRQRGGGNVGDMPALPSAAVQSISRDIVTPESLPEFERLQHALRRAQRAEVRYAILHPTLGERWLLTKVEPATLASGERTTSVVTLDITERQRSQRRGDELLRELTTILDSSTAGIAYIRGTALVRCNRRFVSMLGLPRGHAADVPGRNIDDLLTANPVAQRIAAETLRALANSNVYETEFAVPARAQWYALSVRRTGPVTEQIEAIAVVSDITRLKVQQAELEILARDRELMFSLSGIGIAFVRDGAIQRANQGLAQISGHPAADLAGLPLDRLFGAAGEREGTDDALDRQSEAEALRDIGAWSGERRMQRRDGAMRWVQITMRLVHDGVPEAGIIASYVDVDARHRAESAVAHQAERTRAILDSVLVGIVTVGAHGIEWMNRSARRMFGGDLAAFQGRPMSTVATAEPDHPFHQTQYIDELIEGRAETFECKVQALDGRAFWVVGNAVATGRSAEGRQLTYALLDIERRRVAEARSAETQASLQRLIEAAPMAISLRDARSLRLVQANEAAARSVNRPLAAMAGTTPEALFPPAVAAERRADMHAALAASGVTVREYRYTEHGAVRVWDARYTPLSAPGSAPDQLLLVATDVTEQRAAQEAKFEAALAQREMLVREIHHRIKNNLQGVAGLLTQIAARKPEVASSISEVVGQVQAIAQVYGLQVGVSGPLRMQSVFEAITGSVQRTFGRSITLAVEGAAPEGWVLPEAESIPIALCLNELLTNAVKHTQGDGDPAVQCTLQSRDDGVSIRIGNVGRLPPGFDLARLPGAVSGLGLIRALLPRRSARLRIDQEQGRVVATIELAPPGVVRLADGGEAPAATAQQAIAIGA